MRKNKQIKTQIDHIPLRSYFRINTCNCVYRKLTQEFKFNKRITYEIELAVPCKGHYFSNESPKTLASTGTRVNLKPENKTKFYDHISKLSNVWIPDEILKGKFS